MTRSVKSRERGAHLSESRRGMGLTTHTVASPLRDRPELHGERSRLVPSPHPRPGNRGADEHGEGRGGDRPHWLFRPLFRFQGARPEGARSAGTGQNSVHPKVRQPTTSRSPGKSGFRSAFRVKKSPQERRNTLPGEPDRRNPPTCSWNGPRVDRPVAAEPLRGGRRTLAGHSPFRTSAPPGRARSPISRPPSVAAGLRPRTPAAARSGASCLGGPWRSRDHPDRRPRGLGPRPRPGH